MNQKVWFGVVLSDPCHTSGWVYAGRVCPSSNGIGYKGAVGCYLVHLCLLGGTHCWLCSCPCER